MIYYLQGFFLFFFCVPKRMDLLAIHLLEKQINAFSWRLENQLGSFEPPTFEKVSNGSSIGTPFFFFFCVYIYIYIYIYTYIHTYNTTSSKSF